jgi:predicted kinase
MLMRAQRSFVWNATNTTRAMRTQLIDFFVSYGARVRIVYVEASFTDLLRRGATRARPVPETVIRRLAARLDVPDVTEADRVDWGTTQPPRIRHCSSIRALDER